MKVAVFIQAFGLKDPLIWNDVYQCVSNVGKARELADNFDAYPWVNVTHPEPFKFDIFITYTADSDITFVAELESVGADRVFRMPRSQNEGLDIKQFLDQLAMAEDMNHKTDGSYDVFLKLHPKTDPGMRRQIYQSLCGTPSAVLSVLRAFRTEGIGVVAPQGFLVKNTLDKQVYYKPMRDLYDTDNIFWGRNLDNMKLLYRKMFGTDIDGDISRYVCGVGTMFWSRYRDFHVREWVGILPWLSTQWTQGYTADQGMEHAMERLFLTIPYLNGSRVATLPPALKTIGIYLPQFYEIPEKNEIHGQQAITDWTVLKASQADNLAKPLDEKHGGLGYYDLLNVEIRRKQGEMAKAAGLHGFMFYHYWVTGDSEIKYANSALGKIAELMLEDGKPDLPFMFCWTKHSQTGPDDNNMEQLPQKYDEEWEEHFYYLLPFFKHHNYITVDDKPVFVLFRIGQMRDVLVPMLKLWRGLAVKNGLKGLHIIHALNNFISIDKVFQDSSLLLSCDANFQYFPTLKGIYHIENSTSESEVFTPSNQRQYWGGFTNFHNNVRRSVNSTVRPITPQKFREDFRHTLHQMVTELPYSENQFNAPNLFFLTAWNQWNEQAVLEPSDKYGFSYLSAVKENLENQPLTIIDGS